MKRAGEIKREGWEKLASVKWQRRKEKAREGGGGER